MFRVQGLGFCWDLVFRVFKKSIFFKVFGVIFLKLVIYEALSKLVQRQNENAFI